MPVMPEWPLLAAPPQPVGPPALTIVQGKRRGSKYG
jgi:hypothetical protein